jgi:hypothetical protein
MENLNVSGGYYFNKEKMGYEEYNFTSNPIEILEALTGSKHEEKMVALIVPSIGEGLFITAVDDIVEEGGEAWIILKHYDSTGFMIERNRIGLSEIVGACTLNSKWKNPFMKIVIKDNVPWIKVEERL